MLSEINATAIVVELDPEESSAPISSLELVNKLFSSLTSVDKYWDTVIETILWKSENSFRGWSLRSQRNIFFLGYYNDCLEVKSTYVFGIALFSNNSLPLVGDQLVLASLYLSPYSIVVGCDRNLVFLSLYLICGCVSTRIHNSVFFSVFFFPSCEKQTRFNET